MNIEVFSEYDDKHCVPTSYDTGIAVQYIIMGINYSNFFTTVRDLLLAGF